jgi:protein-arginine kinase activator protein McsA
VGGAGMGVDCAEDLDFEKAAEIRDRIRQLKLAQLES